jgi:stage II sporulation protein AA (anti-sigma F factor antagonist)
MSTLDACQITTVATDDQVVVVVAGEVDLLTLDAVSSALTEAQASRRDLVVDLSATTFMDSSGLHAVLDAFRAQRDAGRSFSLRAPSGAVVRVLEMAGLEHVLPTVARP